ncbi:MAG: hypothetical protein WCG26_05855 [Chloroflexales bacterium]
MNITKATSVSRHVVAHTSSDKLHIGVKTSEVRIGVDSLDGSQMLIGMTVEEWRAVSARVEAMIASRA